MNITPQYHSLSPRTSPPWYSARVSLLNHLVDPFDLPAPSASFPEKYVRRSHAYMIPEKWYTSADHVAWSTTDTWSTAMPFLGCMRKSIHFMLQVLLLTCVLMWSTIVCWCCGIVYFAASIVRLEFVLICPFACRFSAEVTWSDSMNMQRFFNHMYMQSNAWRNQLSQSAQQQKQKNDI